MAATKRKPVPISAQSAWTVPGAMIALRGLFKKEYGIDVNVEVGIHGWPHTHYLAQIAVEDMVRGLSEWETEHRTMDASADQSGKLSFFVAKGREKSPMGGLELTIFKSEKGKSYRPGAIPRPNKKTSNAVHAMLRIRSMIKGLYGAEANIKVSARVEVSKYSFIPSHNPHLSQASAAEILTSIAAGTQWSQREVSTYYSRTGRKRLELSGDKTEVEIYFDLPRENEERQPES